MNLLIVVIAKYLYIVIGLIALGYWLTLPKRQKIRLAVFGIITAVFAFALAKIGGAVYYDPRPFVTQHIAALYPHAADNGFPSDHTLLAAVIAVTVYASSRRLGAALFVMAILVGLARVMAHIHSPIDIIGSLIFAAVGGVIAFLVTPRILSRVEKS